MFKSYKRLGTLDIRDSYVHQQQRKKQRNRYVKVGFAATSALLVMALLIQVAHSMPSNAQHEPKSKGSTDNAHIHGPQLLFEDAGNLTHIAFPVDMSADIQVNGLLAYAEIKQVFINPSPKELSAKYQFPLPDNAAIKYLKVNVGDTEIIGQIMEKKAAKVVFNKAKKQGQKASLVEQQRTNLFTNKIANIPANSRVTVTLKLILPVAFENAQFRLQLPLAMTARYQPHRYQDSPAEEDPELLAPVTKSMADSHAAINLHLNVGAVVTSINSDSHKISSTALTNDHTSHRVTLADTQTLADRDFVLTWQVRSGQHPSVSSYSEKIGADFFTLLTFLPPQKGDGRVLARDIIFVIDTSGSMQGESIVQAKRSVQQALRELTAQDSFNIIAFDSTTKNLFHSTQMASPRNLKLGQQFVNRLIADNGTEMYRPLSQALVMEKAQQQSHQALRQIVFITDGAVANEYELMQLLDSAEQNFRLFTVGIGAAPNGYFMKKAAQFGRGSYEFIQNTHEVQAKMSGLMEKIKQPTLSNIALVLDNNVHPTVEIYPQRLPDLYLNQPLQVTIKSDLPITDLHVSGDTATSVWQQSLVLNHQQPAKGISTLWARYKIADLLDSLVTGADPQSVKSEVIATSITHQTLSPYTSFIAVEPKPTDIPALVKVTDATVAMPKTAIGWLQQLILGIGLALLGVFSLRFGAR